MVLDEDGGEIRHGIHDLQTRHHPEADDIDQFQQIPRSRNRTEYNVWSTMIMFSTGPLVAWAKSHVFHAAIEIKYSCKHTQARILGVKNWAIALGRG